MATITSYLLISDVEDPENVTEKEFFDTYDFERSETYRAEDDQVPALKYVVEHPLEDRVELEEAVCEFSTEVPEATVVLCEVEERFNQVERLQMIIFRNGKRGGEVEHGYIFNVGPG